MAAMVWVYMTAKDDQQALVLSRELVVQRLAACVNILGPIRSIYWWDGKVNDEREIAFVAKTRKALLPKLTATVKKLHSYKCPCIVALPVAGGSADFLSWIAEQTQLPKKRRGQRRET